MLDNPKETWRMLTEKGEPPRVGVLRFSVGIESLLQTLRDEYLEKVLEKEHGSADKLVVGTYGSGKTHFLRAVGETSAERGFVTSYVKLSRVEEFENLLHLARSVLSGISLPLAGESGQSVFEGIADRKRRAFAAAGMPDPEAGLREWVRAVRFQTAWPHAEFGRVMGLALEWTLDEREEVEQARYWLLGNIPGPLHRKTLGVAAVSGKADAHYHGRNLLLSWLAFLHNAGYPGTCLLLDEAERAFNVRGAAQVRALGVLRALGDTLLNDQPKATLLLTAVTPEVVDQFATYPALYQRYKIVREPFCSSEPHSPQIRLDMLPDSPLDLLTQLGQRLLVLASEVHGRNVHSETGRSNLRRLAEYSLTRTLEVSHRRLFVRTATSLIDRDARAPADREWPQQEIEASYDGIYRKEREQSSDDADGD